MVSLLRLLCIKLTILRSSLIQQARNSGSGINPTRISETYAMLHDSARVYGADAAYFLQVERVGLVEVDPELPFFHISRRHVAGFAGKGAVGGISCRGVSWRMAFPFSRFRACCAYQGQGFLLLRGGQIVLEGPENVPGPQHERACQKDEQDGNNPPVSFGESEEAAEAKEGCLCLGALLSEKSSCGGRCFHALITRRLGFYRVLGGFFSGKSFSTYLGSVLIAF